MSKRKTKFNYEWIKGFGFISRIRKDYFHVFCTVCCCNVEIGCKGKSAHTTNIISPPFLDCNVLF